MSNEETQIEKRGAGRPPDPKSRASKMVQYIKDNGPTSARALHAIFGGSMNGLWFSLVNLRRRGLLDTGEALWQINTKPVPKKKLRKDMPVVYGGVFSPKQYHDHKDEPIAHGVPSIPKPSKPKKCPPLKIGMPEVGKAARNIREGNLGNAKETLLR